MSDKTPHNGPVFVVEQPAPPANLFARYKAWMAGKPWYYHVVAVALASLIGGVIGHYFPEAKPYIPDPMLFGKADRPAPQTTNATSEEMIAAWRAGSPEPLAVTYATTDTEARTAEGRRIVAERMRYRAERELMRSGYKLAGGDATPLSEAEARKQVAKLSNRMIAEAGREVGALGFVSDGPGGGILAWLRAVFQWMKEHPEQVEAWLKLLLSLLMFL